MSAGSLDMRARMQMHRMVLQSAKMMHNLFRKHPFLFVLCLGCAICSTVNFAYVASAWITL